jgi:hypothetical protein
MPRIAALFLIVLLPLPSARAQALVGGFVVEKSSRRPIACLDVQLLDSAGRFIDSTRSLPDGGFQFTAAAPGEYRIRFSAFGLTPLITGVTVANATAESVARYELDLAPHDSLAALLRLKVGDSLPERVPRRGKTPPRPMGLPFLDGEHTYQATVGYAVDDAGVADSLRMFVVRSDHPAMTRYAIGALAVGVYRPARESGAPMCRFLLTTITLTRRPSR